MSRRRIVAIIAAVVLALTGLACNGDPQGPGETRCVDEDGHRAPCPEEW